jgi:ABC-type multidrug transport system fused ATPase/permease subunit
MIMNKIKAFKLNMVGFDANSSGQLINIISTDCARVEYSILFMPFLFVAPVELIVVIVILFNLVDKTILSGLAVVAIALPIQSMLGKVFDHMR